MKESMDQLARNLAAGVSRRKALWQFLSGLGAVTVLTGRKANALGISVPGPQQNCSIFCTLQAENFNTVCVAASAICTKLHGNGYCAELTCSGIGINSTESNGPNNLPEFGTYTCVPVNAPI
jgi:hypothetical protein